MTFKLITTKRFINTTVKTFGTFGQFTGYFGPFKWSTLAPSRKQDRNPD